MKYLGLMMLAVLIGAPFAAPVQAGETVEVLLVDRLDDQRGFCLDIRGYKQRARVDRGLQAHSCYSYQGQIGVDQGFDSDAIKTGRFHMPGFDVCMTATAETGARLNLAKCDGSSGQGFSMTANGEIVAKAAPKLCVTVAGGDSREGGGGRPVHLIRGLTLETCDEARGKYQRWRVRTKAD
ncbi:MAG: ricin-type beta-trefoil lectin domain protein [Deltaproteobacteria bacterium]|nr:ricin-type beta-trefoil lectin domain protein [Deltaproteobacteria bacterium]